MGQSYHLHAQAHSWQAHCASKLGLNSRVRSRRQTQGSSAPRWWQTQWWISPWGKSEGKEASVNVYVRVSMPGLPTLPTVSYAHNQPSSALSRRRFKANITTHFSRDKYSRMLKTEHNYLLRLYAWLNWRLGTVITTQQGTEMSDRGVKEQKNAGAPLLTSASGRGYCSVLTMGFVRRERKGNSPIPLHPPAQSG